MEQGIIKNNVSVYEQNRVVLKQNESSLHELKNDIDVYSHNIPFINKYFKVINGNDVFVIGSGPSLNYIDVNKYKNKNTLIMGVNGQIFNHSINLDFFFSSDYYNMLVKKITPDLLKMKANEGVHICLGRNIQLKDSLRRSKYYITDDYLSKLSNKFDLYYFTNKYKAVIDRHYTGLLYALFSIGQAPLSFSVFCGAKRVFLCGFDQGGNVYADGSIRSKSAKDSVSATPTDLKAISGYKNLLKLSKKLGYSTEIYSVNPVNMKGIFTDVYTSSYLEANSLSGDAYPLLSTVKS